MSSIIKTRLLHRADFSGGYMCFQLFWCKWWQSSWFARIFLWVLSFWLTLHELSDNEKWTKFIQGLECLETKNLTILWKKKEDYIPNILAICWWYIVIFMKISKLISLIIGNNWRASAKIAISLLWQTQRAVTMELKSRRKQYK